MLFLDNCFYLVDEVWLIIVKKLKFSEVLIFPLCQKDYQVTILQKKFVNAMRISEHIVSFDEDFFQFLQDELKSLGKNIGEKFNEKIVINCFVFGLVDILLKKIVYGLLPFSIYCHLFFC